MSDVVGAALPEDLLDTLSSTPSGSPRDEAILIATTDSSGRPHPALLSYGEVRARNASTLRFATYASSTTARNLRDRGAITLCFVGPGSAVYVKARARELERGTAPPGIARFEATVEEVRRDRARAELEGAAEITSGITFRVPDPAAKAREWVVLHEALA